MARESFDGRLVTRCDGCGQDIDGRFVGAPALSEFLGMGFCPDCSDGDPKDFAQALLESPFLSETGKTVVRDWFYLQGPPEVRNLVALHRDDGEVAGTLFEGREN
jgi:hypothetical protein